MSEPTMTWNSRPILVDAIVSSLVIDGPQNIIVEGVELEFHAALPEIWDMTFATTLASLGR